MSKSIKIKKLFKKIVVIVFNNFSQFAKSKVTKLKLKIKNTSTTSFSTFAKKLASKTFLFIVVFFDFNVDSIINNNKFFDNNINNKTSIDTTIVTKISLKKKNKFIINKIASRRERCLSNKRFKAFAFWEVDRANRDQDIY